MECILCGKHDDFRIVVYRKGMRWDCWGHHKFIIKCKKCGLLFLEPKWTEEELNKLYKNYLNQKDFDGQIQAPRITKYLTKYLKKQTMILEIGCGKGENVKYLNRLGYSIDGIDKDPTYCDNFHIFNIDYRYHNCKVHFIYAIQVFEHMDNPEEFIEKILDMLTIKGKFLLEIPNIKDPLLTLYKINEFKKFYYIPHHLFYWSPQTIKIFFDKLGIKIKIKLLQKYGLINHLRWIIFKVPGNWHPHIPLIDNLYKFILTHIFKLSDTIIIVGEKNE
jgi:SAM-dependent methyltransferase